MCSSDLEFPFFSQPFVSLRTLRDTSALGSEMSSETWAAEVTRRRGEYSARLKSALRTNENGSSSWPTVGANEDSYRIGGDSQASKSLSGMARRGELSWPTASSRDHKGAPQSRLTPDGYNTRLDEAVVIYGQAAQANPSMDGSHQGSWATPRVCSAMAATISAEAANNPKRFPNLETQVGKAQWATPIAGDWKGQVPSQGEPRMLSGVTEKAQGGKLNPRWVETLMGLPVGWVMPSCASPVTIELMNCEPSAMELFPQPPQSPSQR